MNKSLENKVVDVLVENLTDDKTQVFGRSEHMTSVIFNGKELITSIYKKPVSKKVQVTPQGIEGDRQADLSVHGGFEYRAAFHEPGPKKIMGKIYQEDGENEGLSVLDDLARHPATATFIATKLVRHFVADNPPAGAVDKIAGWMFLNNIPPQNKVFYTTGRLTTEMVIKTVQMQIPVLVSRSGFTAEAVDLARRAGLTLIGRAKGKRFIALSGIDRIVFDSGDDDEFADAPSLQRTQQGTHQGTGR